MFPHYEDCQVWCNIHAACTGNCHARMLGNMRAYDSETWLFTDGNHFPPLVAGSTSDSQGRAQLLSRAACFDFIHRHANSNAMICGTNLAFDFSVMAAEDPSSLYLIIKMYTERRVWDIAIAEALTAIAKGHLEIDPRTGQKIKNAEGKASGRYSLDYCTSIRLGRADAKRHDFWRLRYYLLRDIPIDQYPDDAKAYMIDDACNPVAVASAQLTGYYQGLDRNLGNLCEQGETHLWMQLGANWGLRTNPERVKALASKVEIAHAKMQKRYQALGYIRPDETEDTQVVKRAVAVAYGAGENCGVCLGTGKVPSERRGKPVACKVCDSTGYNIDACPTVPRTIKGKISTSRDTLSESGDDDLSDYGENETEKIRNTYLPYLRRGTTEPLCPDPNILLATGRTSYKGLVQLMPKQGGVRECHQSRPGYFYFSVDYAAIQLCTLAQICLWSVGYSRMAEVINETGNPGMLHNALGAELLGMSLEQFQTLYLADDERCIKARHGAKAPNFGLPGMMGEVTFVASKRARSEGETIGPDGRVYSGIRFCILLDGAVSCGEVKVTEWRGRPCVPLCKRCLELVAYRIKPIFFRKWPEITDYFKWVQWQVDRNGSIPCFTPPFGVYVDRIRGNVTAPQAANNGFQALESDIMKDSWRHINRECYLDRGSVLYGTRPILIGHDEAFGETPQDRAHLAAARIVEIMEERAALYLPDVKHKAEHSLMRFWSKKAKPVYRNGILIPYEDAHA